MVNLNIAALDFEDANDDDFKTSRSGLAEKYADLKPILAASEHKGKTVALNSEDEVKEFRSALRVLAADMGKGVRIVVEGNRIKFSLQNKRDRRPYTEDEKAAIAKKRAATMAAKKSAKSANGQGSSERAQRTVTQPRKATASR